MTRSLELPTVLEPLRLTIETLLSPCILLLPEQTATGHTHFGGAPRLAPGSAWPSGPDGPLSFVGQLDFAQAVGAGGVELGLPDRGLLALFCDEQYWTGDSPQDRNRFHLAYTLDAEHGVELEPPPDLDAADLAPHAPERGLSLPDIADRIVQAYQSLQEGKRGDAYIALAVAFADQQRRGTGEDDHRLRGHAAWAGEDGRLTAQLASSGFGRDRASDPRALALTAGAAAWNLLWQVDTINLPGWSEVGTFQVLIRDEDLAARAFDRAWVVHQTP